MKDEKPHRKGKSCKISKALMAFALVSVFFFGPIIYSSRIHDSAPIQRLDSPGNCGLKDRQRGYFTPTPNYILGAAGTLPNVAHFESIFDYDYLLSRPSITRLIESAQGGFHAANLADSSLKARAPPLFLPDKSIL